MDQSAVLGKESFSFWRNFSNLCRIINIRDTPITIAKTPSRANSSESRITNIARSEINNNISAKKDLNVLRKKTANIAEIMQMKKKMLNNVSYTI
jgi:hypothetical protein